MARVVQLSELLEKQRIDNAVTHVWQYVPSGIVTQDVLDNVEKAKQPLVKIYHYHCNHLGTPQELSDENGNIIWLSYDRAWGGSFETIYKPQFIDNFSLDENELQPIKFQGQSLDTETGLHYNRFRYYDSDVGMFISRDPIELLGGFNVFAYAPNPIGWIDPLGLKELYHLLASKDGFYPVMEWGSKDNVGGVFLKKGEIWKIGETKNIKDGKQRRYTQKWLDEVGLDYVVNLEEPDQKLRRAEETKQIKDYHTKNGKLPPGNKCLH